MSRSVATILAMALASGLIASASAKEPAPKDGPLAGLDLDLDQRADVIDCVSKNFGDRADEAAASAAAPDPVDGRSPGERLALETLDAAPRWGVEFQACLDAKALPIPRDLVPTCFVLTFYLAEFITSVRTYGIGRERIIESLSPATYQGDERRRVLAGIEYYWNLDVLVPEQMADMNERNFMTCATQQVAGN